LRVAEKWKIGRKGQDNGALFLIAKNDRKMRIEVGYGLEGVLPDVTANRIIREDVAPAFARAVSPQASTPASTASSRWSAATLAAGEDDDSAKSRFGGFGFDQVLFVLFFVVPVAGAMLRGIFGRLGGSVVGGGAIGVVVWLVLGSILFGIVGGSSCSS
jgi:uncharacterized protein